MKLVGIAKNKEQREKVRLTCDQAGRRTWSQVRVRHAPSVAWFFTRLHDLHLEKEIAAMQAIAEVNVEGRI